MVLSIFDSEIGSTFAKNCENMPKREGGRKGREREGFEFSSLNNDWTRWWGSVWEGLRGGTGIGSFTNGRPLEEADACADQAGE